MILYHGSNIAIIKQCVIDKYLKFIGSEAL